MIRSAGAKPLDNAQERLGINHIRAVLYAQEYSHAIVLSSPKFRVKAPERMVGVRETK